MKMFELFGDILIKDNDAIKKLDDIDKKASGLGSTFKKVAGVLAGLKIGETILEVGKKSIESASDMEEMQGKFNVVFKGIENDVENWASKFSDAVGRSRNSVKTYLADNQNLFVGMGMTREQGSKLSEQVVSLGVDLASFNNLQDDEAIKSLTSALMGESEAAKSLGAVLNDNTIKMAMERMQLQGKFQDLDEATKMQVRYTAIQMQSTDAIGDAERTSGSYANQLRKLKGQWDDLLAQAGTKIIPMATSALFWINTNMPIIEKVIGTTFSVVGKVINEVGDIIKNYIMPTFNFLRNQIEKEFPEIKAFIMEMYNVVKPSFDTLISTIQTYLVPVFNSLWSLIQQCMPVIKEIIKVAFEAVVISINIAIDIINTAIKVIAGIYDFIRPGLELVISIFNKVTSVIETAFGWLSKWNGTKAENKSINVTTNYLKRNSSSENDNSLDGYATGTDYADSGWHLVGEEGVELMNFKGGEQVLNHKDTKDLLKGSSGLTINIEKFVNNRKEDIKALAEELEFYRKQTSIARGGV